MRIGKEKCGSIIWLILLFISINSFAQNEIPAARIMGELESYANGKVSGSWHFNKFNDDETGTYGHKTVHSAYDSLNNLAYILSDARNVAVAPLSDSASLEITNQRVVIQGNLFLGVPTPKEKFHLIAAIQPKWNTGSIFYSDDSGQSWKKSKNGDLSNQEVKWSTILEDQNKTVLVLTLSTVTKARSKTNIYSLIRSIDQGKSFSEVIIWEENEASEVLACKPYNINEVYFVKKINNSNLFYTQILNLESKTFEQVSVHYTDKTPTSIVGTCHQDTTWFYMGAKSGGFVSNDGEKVGKPEAYAKS